jgi:hypothetical protein
MNYNMINLKGFSNILPEDRWHRQGYKKMGMLKIKETEVDKCKDKATWTTAHKP